MLGINDLHEYQLQAVDFIIDNPYSGLFLDLGLGKSISTLTAIDRLMFEELEVSKVLVIAPKKVAENTWSKEIAKWEHTQHFKISKVLGPEKKRKEALRQDADIYIINRENVVWLVNYFGGTYFPFDMLVIDELSSFKSPKSQRFKALRMVRPKINRVVGLTATPAPNGLCDLWSQIYLLDQGERLEKNVTQYRAKYFTPGRSNGHVVFNYKLNEGSEKIIHEKISDICISMKAADYLKLPPRIDRMEEVCLSGNDMELYLEFEKEQVLSFVDGDTITADNKAALSNKLLQYANGALYSDNGPEGGNKFSDKKYHIVQDAKLDRLEEIVDTANGQPILIFYQFQSDLDRIMKRLKAYKPIKLTTSQDEDDWNDGKIPVCLVHAMSGGHGLNLQKGGNIICWFGIPWSLELYQQANGRIHRQGQTRPVIIHHLIVPGTYDEDVLKSLQSKDQTQDYLMVALNARARKYLANSISV